MFLITSVIIAAVAVVIGFVLKQDLIEKYRQRLAFAGLLGGCFVLPCAGFRVSEAVGFFSVSVVLLMIAFLFGYDRG